MHEYKLPYTSPGVSYGYQNIIHDNKLSYISPEYDILIRNGYSWK